MKKLSRPKVSPIALYILGLLVVAGAGALAFPAFKGARVVPIEPKTSDCRQTGETVVVDLGPEKISPNPIKVNQCDEIIFNNKTKAIIEIAMGNHDNHVEYPGLEEILTEPGRSYTLLAARTGQYHVHDHINDELEATLVVYEK